MAVKVLDGVDNASQRLIHIADGSAADDAASWGQVQQLIAGLEWKADVTAASTANVSLAAPGASMDGYAFNNGDRVLLKNQTTQTQNGVYVWSGATSALVRATDADASSELNNATVFVVNGTVNAGTAWTQVTKNPVLGTDNLVFNQFGAGVTYSAASNGGLSLSGTAFSIKLPGSGVIGLIVDSTGIYIDVSVVVQKKAFNVGDGSSTSIALTHSLGTRDVTVSLQDATSHAFVMTDWVATDANTVTLSFAVAPTSNQYRATIHG